MLFRLAERNSVDRLSAVQVCTPATSAATLSLRNTYGLLASGIYSNKV
jgi:hypothetical protein